MRRSTTLILILALTVSLGLTSGARADENCEYPRVMIVLDHSDSMSRTIEGGDTSLWAVTVDAIRQMVLSYEESIAFGLMIFPDPVDNGCAPGTVMLEPAPLMADEIVEILDLGVPIPDRSLDAFTPIKQTFDALSAAGTLWDDSTRNYVLFITDGEQYCDCPEGDDSACTADSSRPADLLALGVPSFIMGLSTQTNSCLMARMAIYGGTARDGCPYDSADFSCNNPWDPDVEHPEKVCYYQADDSTQVLSALENIGREVTDEQCDLLDNDCDGLTDEDLVRGCETDCGPGEQVCENGAWLDCEPLDVDDEFCNGIDDDCDGETDEDLTRPCYTDCGEGLETCVKGDWEGCTAPQPFDEECGNGIDDDCDGETDEGCDCSPGAEQACGQSDEGACAFGTQQCSDDATWDACVGNIDPVEESCNAVDDDCDGETDEALERACESACGAGVESCEGGAWGGCTAPEPVAESCNGLDDDCDGTVDNDATCAQGEHCESGACVPDETDDPSDPNEGLPVGSEAGSASGCQAGSGAAPGGLLLLLLALALVWRRRCV